MAIHVATFVQVHVDSVTSEIFTKSGAQIKDFQANNLTKPHQHARNFSTEFRVAPDSTIPNTTGYPTLQAYLTLEAAGGFKFKHVDQTYIITEN